MSDPVTLHDIYLARSRIAGQAMRTPLILSQSLSARFDTEVYLKLETLQPSGAFKLRGALNKIASLSPEQLERGVTTASTGNHGRAVAWAAKRLGLHGFPIGVRSQHQPLRSFMARRSWASGR